mgnify:FL=1
MSKRIARPKHVAGCRNAKVNYCAYDGNASYLPNLPHPCPGCGVDMTDYLIAWQAHDEANRRPWGGEDGPCAGWGCDTVYIHD